MNRQRSATFDSEEVARAVVLDQSCIQCTYWHAIVSNRSLGQCVRFDMSIQQEAETGFSDGPHYRECSPMFCCEEFKRG